MADETVEVKSGTGIPVAVDTTPTGNVQITKLAQSAEASRVPIPADAEGLLVNLGANRDVVEDNSAAILVAQQAILTALGLPLAVTAADAATEGTLGDVLVAVDALAALIVTAHLDVRELNSAAIKTAVEKIDDFITGARGLVTEDNSAAILAKLNASINVAVTDGGGGDASEATSALIQTATEAVLAALNAGIDVNTGLSGGATEVTLAAVLSDLGLVAADSTLTAGVNALLSAISPKATEATLASILAALGATLTVDTGITGGATEATLADVLAALTGLSVTITGDVAVAPDTPNADVAYAASEVHSTAYEASHVVKATPGVLYQVSGFNSKATPQFIQIHNAASLPADAAVPVHMFWVDGLSNFTWDCGRFPEHFSVGVVMCNSSTGPTKTIGSADCWFNALYK